MATSRKYGKIDNQGKIVNAPTILRLPSGGVVMDPGEADLLNAGYLPIVEHIPAHDENDIVQIDHYEVVNGEIVITYKVFDDSESNAGTPELNERIAVLTSQNTILANQNEELTSANETLSDELEVKETQTQSYQEMYLSEHAKVFDLESEVESYRSQYISTEELREQVNFYREAAARAHYEQYEDGMEKTDNILCYGEKAYKYVSPYGEDSDDSISDTEIEDSSSDDDTQFYKTAHIISKVQFVPLQAYTVTNGDETRILVYTPPDRSFIMGNLPIPVEEAHGGDWVEIKLTDEESSDSTSDSDDNSDSGTSVDESNVITIYSWMDLEGRMHIGKHLPSEYVSSGVITTIDMTEDSSDSSDSPNI